MISTQYNNNNNDDNNYNYNYSNNPQLRRFNSTDHYLTRGDSWVDRQSNNEIYHQHQGSGEYYERGGYYARAADFYNSACERRVFQTNQFYGGVWDWGHEGALNYNLNRRDHCRYMHNLVQEDDDDYYDSDYDPDDDYDDDYYYDDDYDDEY